MASGVAVKAIAYPTPPPENPDDPLASSNRVNTVTAQVRRLDGSPGLADCLLR